MAVNDRREIFGWAMYDWANSGFQATVITVMAGPYLTSLARREVGENGIIFSAGPLLVTEKSLFPFCIGLSVFLQIFLLPTLGAIADYTNLKKRLMAIHRAVTAGASNKPRKVQKGIFKERVDALGKEMVAKVYKILRDKKVEIDQQTWNRRYREYTEKIKTGSVLEIAKVLRDLFVLKGDKELSFGERKMLDTARNLLVKELAIAKAHTEEKIMEELKGIFAN